MKKKLLALLVAGSMLASIPMFGSCAFIEQFLNSEQTSTSTPDESSSAGPEEETMPYDKFAGITNVMNMDITLEITLAEDGTYAVSSDKSFLAPIFETAGGTYTFENNVYTLVNGTTTYTSIIKNGQYVIEDYTIVGPEATIVVDFKAGTEVMPYDKMGAVTNVMNMDIVLEITFAEDGTYAVSSDKSFLATIFANAGGTYTFANNTYTLVNGSTTYTSVEMNGKYLIEDYTIVGPEATIVVDFSAGEEVMPYDSFGAVTNVMNMDIVLALTLAEDGTYAVSSDKSFLATIFANAGGTYTFENNVYTLVNGTTTYTSTYDAGVYTIADYTIVGPEATITVDFVTVAA